MSGVKLYSGLLGSTNSMNVLYLPVFVLWWWCVCVCVGWYYLGDAGHLHGSAPKSLVDSILIKERVHCENNVPVAHVRVEVPLVTAPHALHHLAVRVAA
jgi:hypothetical protein